MLDWGAYLGIGVYVRNGDDPHHARHWGAYSGTGVYVRNGHDPHGALGGEASADPNTAGVDHLRATYHDHLLLVVKAMVIGLICMLW